MRYSKQILTAALVSTLLVAPASARNAVMMTLPDKRIAVISEGDLEPASIGSYTVALYKDDGLIDYLGGGIFARDGSVFGDKGEPRVSFADITGDGNPEMIIAKLTAGSGNYLDVDVLKLGDSTVERVLNFASDTKKDLLIEAKRAYSQQQQNLKNHKTAFITGSSSVPLTDNRQEHGYWVPALWLRDIQHELPAH